MEKNELTHHGILGQKWYVRRFQNKDGTLTPLGKLRKGIADRKKSKGESKSEGSEKKSSSKPKSIADMSNEELEARIDRLKLEKRYKDAVKDLSKKDVSRGRKLVQDVLEYSVKNIGQQYATYLLGTALNKLAKEKVVNPKKGQKDK